MSGRSNGQASGSSTSSRPHSPNFSPDSPQFSVNDGSYHAASSSHGSYSPGDDSLEADEHLVIHGDTKGTSNYEPQAGHRYGKQGIRRSGGFLLNSTSNSIVQSTGARRTASSTNHDIKGKRRAVDTDSAVPKRRTIHQRHPIKPVVGGSPLSIELLNNTTEKNTKEGSGLTRGEILPIPSKTRHHVHSIAGSSETSGPVHSISGHEAQQKASSALGHGTDPAQIVSLALNLSESRRRNVSIGSSPPMNIGSRRIPILAHHSTDSPNSGGSLRQYLQAQRHTARNVSPRSGKFGSRDISSSSSPWTGDGNVQHTTVHDLDSNSADAMGFNPSEATLARAEKARTTLELFYEYRRLLPHLPKLPTENKPKSLSNRPSENVGQANSQELGRGYNPLQYIRNRKVRVRQRRMLDGETDGWNDVHKVRSWVDIVEGERNAHMSSVDDRYPLPPFESRHVESTQIDSIVEPSVNQQQEASSNKPRRPRLDWSFTPWDLLADAYWLHQDDNISHIEDRNRKKIVSDERLSETPPRSSKDFASGSITQPESINRQSLAPENLQSLLGHTRNHSSERGRQRHDPNEPKLPIFNNASSRDRRSRWPRRTIQSRSSSTSNESFDTKLRDGGYLRSLDPESAALEKQMREMLKKESENGTLRESIDMKNGETVKIDESKSNSAQNLTGDGMFAKGSSQPATVWQDVHYGRSASDKIQRSPRASFDVERDQHLRQSLDEPKKPDPIFSDMRDQVPSIAIDASPSTTQMATTRKGIPSWISSHRRNLSKDRQSISKRDFEVASEALNKVLQQDTNGSKSQDILNKDQGANGTKLLSPTAAEALSRKPRRSDKTPARGTRDANVHESKLRGFFKGGKIADFVGNEVHKVGDRLWKKESFNDLSRVSTKSGYISDESELDEDLSGLDSSPENRLPRKMNDNGDNPQLSQSPALVDRSRYSKQLPSFRSPFSKVESPNGSKLRPSEDHITRQQIEQRERGRSRRFEKNAPPRINIEGISPPTSFPVIRSHLQVAKFDDESRQSSSSRSDNQRAANRRLNAVLGIPGNVRSDGPPVSLLSSLESHQLRSDSRSSFEGQRHWSISDRGVSPVRGAVTKREIARIQALLLSSGVKANEIVRRSQEVRYPPSALIQSLGSDSKRALPHVPRSQEHLLAARLLISNIEASNRQLQSAAEEFSSSTAKNLHEGIQAVDDHVTFKLTPAVHAAADEADLFSTQLTTTYTLAVKQLNDSLDIILRRRGRRFRWIRRAGYVLLEWTLLGLMWWAWLIVVIVRLVRGTIMGFLGAVRWFFWL